MEESKELFKRNREFFRAYTYVKKLYEAGALTRDQTRRAIRYFADYFDAPMRLFI